jgi:hypothetical protein
MLSLAIINNAGVMLNSYEGIVCIGDGATYHKSWEIKELLAAVNQSSQ